jgi:hypothetical protein
VSIDHGADASPAAIAGVIAIVVCRLHQLYHHTKAATAALRLSTFRLNPSLSLVNRRRYVLTGAAMAGAQSMAATAPSGLACADARGRECLCHRDRRGTERSAGHLRDGR